MRSRGLSEEGPLRVASKHAEQEQDELRERLARVLSTERDAEIMHAACEFVCLFVCLRPCMCFKLFVCVCVCVCV